MVEMQGGFKEEMCLCMTNVEAVDLASTVPRYAASATSDDDDAVAIPR
jgi:hypothetical protein